MKQTLTLMFLLGISVELAACSGHTKNGGEIP